MDKVKVLTADHECGDGCLACKAYEMNLIPCDDGFYKFEEEDEDFMATRFEI